MPRASNLRLIKRREERMTRSIGQVTKTGEKFCGFIVTALVKGSLEFLPNRAKSTEKQPDYLIYFDGHEAGAGWLATEKEGMDYRSINCSIDDPSFPVPLTFSTGRASHQDDDDLYNLIWNRRPK